MLGFGQLARLHGELDLARVVPIVRAALAGLPTRCLRAGTLRARRSSTSCQLALERIRPNALPALERFTRWRFSTRDRMADRQRCWLRRTNFGVVGWNLLCRDIPGSVASSWLAF